MNHVEFGHLLFFVIQKHIDAKYFSSPDYVTAYHFGFSRFPEQMDYYTDMRTIFHLISDERSISTNEMIENENY